MMQGWLTLGVAVLLFAAGFLLGIGYAWRLARMTYLDKLRRMVPIDLVRWQMKDRQLQVDERDTRPRSPR